ncbi:MAG: KH domain-containing protein [Candidatus Pacebacteria bacterium]|nr:KH domain-containing protein [Candidatus Paceibacterota bacterium]
MSQKNLNVIKKAIQEFFEKANFEVDIESVKESEDTVFVSLKMEEPQVLIGEGGQTLNELQHLLKLIIKRKAESLFYLDLDINNYKKKKIEYLKELAVSTANEVSLMRKEKELPPMTAYERRVVHMELASREDVMTESIGEEPERRLIIKPRP